MCSSSGAFLESGGQVVIEAEHFVTNTGRASHTWNLTSNSAASTAWSWTLSAGRWR